MTLSVIGYPTVSQDLEIKVVLHNDSNFEVSSWSLQSLSDAWKQKHSSACYVEYQSQPSKNGVTKTEYLYPGRVLLCVGTSIYKYLDAILSGSIYYDPGHESRPDGYTNQRSQWRLSATKGGFKQTLSPLYNSVEQLDL